MRVIFSYARKRTEADLLRTLENQTERGIVLLVGWYQSPAEILQQVRERLTAEELPEVVAALGLDQPPSSA
jgi:hypothetical protein